MKITENKLVNTAVTMVQITYLMMINFYSKHVVKRKIFTSVDISKTRKINFFFKIVRIMFFWVLAPRTHRATTYKTP